MARLLKLPERELSAIMWQTGLNGECLTRDDTLLTSDQQLQIIRNTIRLSGQPNVGLMLGKMLTPPAHGPIGFLANSSPDLITALRLFQEFLPTRMSFTSLRIETDHAQLCCYFDINLATEPPIIRFIHETFILSLLSVIEFILGRPLHDGDLAIAHATPSYAKQYCDYISCPIEFNANATVLRLPIALAHTANATSDHINFEFALRQCQNMLAQLEDSSHSTTKQVKKLLLSAPPRQLSETDVAAALFISKRTLSRRLADEDTRFSIIRDDLLAAMAADYLRTTTVSVEAIASFLNYHDTANFRRAFKQWFQQTPQAYRATSAAMTGATSGVDDDSATLASASLNRTVDCRE